MERIYVDVFGTLTINKATVLDTAMYECRVDNFSRSWFDIDVTRLKTYKKWNYSESDDQYPLYTSFLLIWFGLFSIAYLSVIVLKVLKYIKFRKNYSRFDQNKVSISAQARINDYVALMWQALRD